MTLFNIQTIKGEVQHDFAFHLTEAIRYQNWLVNQSAYKIIHSEEPGNLPEAIPIGSLEYVFAHLNNRFNIQPCDIVPINIPNQLMKPAFLKRRCQYLNKGELINETAPLFIKSATSYKSFLNITNAFDTLPDDRYLASEPVDIDSEWRCFVGPEGILGLQFYQGDCTSFPDVAVIQQMIYAYTEAPRYYSLDVGINDNGTFIIEVHPIVSCGLYGFSNPRLLPQMMINGFHYMRDRAFEQQALRIQQSTQK